MKKMAVSMHVTTVDSVAENSHLLIKSIEDNRKLPIYDPIITNWVTDIN